MPFGGAFGDYAMRKALRHIVDAHKKAKAAEAEQANGAAASGQPVAQQAQQAQLGTGGGAGQANPEQRAVSLLTDLIPAPPRPGEEDWLFQRNMIFGG
jgi:hypothetical protein